MVNDDAPIGIENEIMLHAHKREIAAELAAVVDRRRARRQDFNHDDGIVDFDRVGSNSRAADDRRVGFICRPGVDPDRHAVWINSAGQPLEPDGLPQGDICLGLGLCVKGPLR